MHTAMSRRFAMVVVLIASTFVPPGAFAVITCRTFNGVPDGFSYCCSLRDSVGNYSVARCRLPCDQGCGAFRDRLRCDDHANNAFCSATQNCGYLCNSKLIGAFPSTPNSPKDPAHFDIVCRC